MANLAVSGFLIMLLFVRTSGQDEARQPPIINTPQTATDLYYSTNENAGYICSAEGIPQPTYKWTQNGTLISPTALITFDSVSGALKIPSFSRREEGIYMCIASNVFNGGQNGQITAVSWSAKIRLLLRRTDYFGTNRTISNTLTEYGYTKFICGSEGSAAGYNIKYNWYVASGTGITMDGDRIYIDLKGNLHFTYVIMKDNQITYRCGVSVDDEKVISLGTVNALVLNSRSPVAIKPQIQSNNSGVKGLINHSIQLECVFSGYDPTPPNIPTISWRDDSGQVIQNNDKYTLSSDRRLLTIKRLEEQDEKSYVCSARNTAGEASQEVTLNVTSVPIFLNGAPLDQTVPEGKNVQFDCSARSASGEDPPGPPTWTVNGAKLGDPSKFQLSQGGTILTIMNVKKATDILCVQCEVTNYIGSILANACLNVILPITILKQPASVQSIRYGDSVDFTVTASTDASMTLSYKWEFKNTSYNDKTPYMEYNPSTLLARINTSGLSQEQYDTIAGLYRRVIYHLYETKVVEIDVVQADRQAAIKAGSGFDLWIIGLIIALILLIIIIIIIIYIICRKKQEGDYNVDKKETGAGLDPEKELKDKDFNAYSRPAHDGYYNYPDPDTKQPGIDPELEGSSIGGDDESLGEYEKEGHTYFNEDGSFIGIYQSKNLPPSAPAESTI